MHGSAQRLRVKSLGLLTHPELEDNFLTSLSPLPTTRAYSQSRKVRCSENAEFSSESEDIEVEAKDTIHRNDWAHAAHDDRCLRANTGAEIAKHTVKIES